MNTGLANPPQLVPYMDLGGGLNTRKDPHALARNELATSINLWPAYDQAVAKRPGSIAIGTSGTGKPCKSLLSCRFNGITYLLEVKTDGNVFAGLAAGALPFTKIGKVNPAALFVTSAQMTDPYQKIGVVPGVQSVFICDGMSTPQLWNGPGTQMQNVFTGTDPKLGAGIPTKDPQGNHPITPQFVTTLGNNSHLFYSGDPDEPSAVYVSDPFYPEFFNSPAMQVNPTKANNPGQYIPAIIGNNDGVEGGKINGMETLGSAMIVFKECAIYQMIATTLLGEIPTWQVVTVSNNRGCLSPRSICAFDTFIVFLALDGIYATDGNTIWLISYDVPTFFDSTLTGQAALITNRTNAIGVRHATRYLTWFLAQSAPNTTGLWFDFSKQTASGMPLCGQIEGMNVGGATALTGEQDDGNVAWSDSIIDTIGKFGIGYSDLGPNNTQVNIAVTMAGKADLLDDVFGPDSVIGEKQAQTYYALVELLGAPAGSQIALEFKGAVLVNNQILLPQAVAQQISQGLSPVGIWGASVWGAFQWGAAAQYGFQVIKCPNQNSARGNLLQFVLTESSQIPWILIGYALYANYQLPGY